MWHYFRYDSLRGILHTLPSSTSFVSSVFAILIIPLPAQSPESQVPGTAVWFGTYEAVVRASTHKRHESPPAAIVIGAGGLAGAAYWVAIYPIDTVKTTQQTAAPGTVPRGFLSTLRSIFAAGGIRALYAGMAPTLVRAFPSNAATFLLYEQAISVMGVP